MKYSGSNLPNFGLCFNRYLDSKARSWYLSDFGWGKTSYLGNCLGVSSAHGNNWTIWHSGIFCCFLTAKGRLFGWCLRFLRSMIWLLDQMINLLWFGFHKRSGRHINFDLRLHFENLYLIRSTHSHSIIASIQFFYLYIFQLSFHFCILV